MTLVGTHGGDPLEGFAHDARRITPERCIPLGLAWAGSSVNCKPYAVEGLIWADNVIYGAFYNDAGWISVYAVADGAHDARVHTCPAERPPIDAHDTPSIQRDSSGRLHVFCGAHVSKPLYLRSGPSGVIEDLEDCSAELHTEMAELTYPFLIKHGADGHLWVLYRVGRPLCNEWHAREWHNQLGRWSEGSRLVIGSLQKHAGTTCGAYLNQPIMLPDEVMGLAIVWRTTGVTGARRNPMNAGIDYVEVRDDFRSLSTRCGIGLSRPLLPAHAERVVAVPWGADLANQCGACVVDGRPCFVSAWRKTGEQRQVRVVYAGTSGAWHDQAVTRFADDETMRGNGTLAMRVSRPAIVAAGRNRAIVLYRDAVDGGRLLAHPVEFNDDACLVQPPLILHSGPLGQYEPTVERLETTTTGKISIFVQYCEQIDGGDGIDSRVSSPAHLITFDIESFFDTGGSG